MPSYPHLLGWHSWWTHQSNPITHRDQWAGVSRLIHGLVVSALFGCLPRITASTFTWFFGKTSIRIQTEDLRTLLKCHSHAVSIAEWWHWTIVVLSPMDCEHTTPKPDHFCTLWRPGSNYVQCRKKRLRAAWFM